MTRVDVEHPQAGRTGHRGRRVAQLDAEHLVEVRRRIGAHQQHAPARIRQGQGGGGDNEVLPTPPLPVKNRWRVGRSTKPARCGAGFGWVAAISAELGVMAPLCAGSARARLCCVKAAPASAGSAAARRCRPDGDGGPARHHRHRRRLRAAATTGLALRLGRFVERAASRGVGLRGAAAAAATAPVRSGLARSTEHTPVSGSSSCTASAAARSPAIAATTERACS